MGAGSHAFALHGLWDGWLQASPVHKPAHRINHQAGTVSMSVGLSRHSSTASQLELSSFWPAWNPRKANVHVDVAVPICLLCLSLNCFYCSPLSLLSTNAFPYVPFLISLSNMFHLLPYVPYYWVYTVQVKWIRLSQWYRASCRQNQLPCLS